MGTNAVAESYKNVARVLQSGGDRLLDEWMSLQSSAVTYRPDLIRESDLRQQSGQFLAAFTAAVASGTDDVFGEAWRPVRELMNELGRSRARLGFTPSDTATFVFSLKQPLFARLRETSDAAESVWAVSRLLDALGLMVIETFVKNREEVILRQQQEMLELSTPVVELWQGVLALPLIGTLDSARTQVVMETLLQAIIDKRATIAIIDITGVPMVDTLVAQHLLKTVAAARLMGADCIISGIRPQIAQTIVHLGVALGEVTTKATLADAFAQALRRTGQKVVAAAAG